VADPPVLAVQPTQGLANRLRVVSSCRVLARYSGRRFELCWRAGPGFSSDDVGQLFENTFRRADPEVFGRRDERALHLFDFFSMPQPGRWRKKPVEVLRRIFDVEAVPVVTYTGCLPWPELFHRADVGAHLGNYQEDYTRAAREWVPVPSIRGAVAGITAGFNGRTVGVHVRRGDALGTPTDRYRKSTDRAFTALMDLELERNPDVSFFLATDCEETESRFRARYRDAVIVNEKKRFVASVLGMPKDNQRDAVVDMFALARTCKIFGNNYSSFSKFAAVIGGISWEAALESKDPLSPGGSVPFGPSPGV
jgi:hypothetical protein